MTIAVRATADPIVIHLADDSELVLIAGEWVELEQDSAGKFLRVLVHGKFTTTHQGVRVFQVWNRSDQPFVIPAGWQIEKRDVIGVDAMDLILVPHGVAFFILDPLIHEWRLLIDHPEELRFNLYRKHVDS